MEGNDRHMSHLYLNSHLDLTGWTCIQIKIRPEVHEVYAQIIYVQFFQPTYMLAHGVYLEAIGLYSTFE